MALYRWGKPIADRRNVILKCVNGSEFPASVEGAAELDEAPAEDELGVVVVIERTSEARVCNAENRLCRIIDAMVINAISIARKFSFLGCFGVAECAELTRMVGMSSFGVFRLVAELGEQTSANASNQHHASFEPLHQ